MALQERDPSPAELRTRLGENLQQLSRASPSISALCRELGINRTQFNRYRAGESFPRPDVLYRICRYFKVDARILLEPVEIVAAAANGPFLHPEVREYLPHKGPEQLDVVLPDGLFRFVRPSAVHQDSYIRGLFLVYRKDGHAFLRGYDPARSVSDGGREKSPAAREFRGALLPQGAGYMAVTARRDGVGMAYNVMEPVKGRRTMWRGFVSWPDVPNGERRRKERQLHEFLGDDPAKVMAAARSAGWCEAGDLDDEDLAYLRG
ncbi:XRE family transcriptional regulator [Roseivivax halodurans JCM 10272]|uniref:XRE family transcriptional regulator n=1 Tax=Roseivivax halodurans JCM 10272 TaxID=1449350 RepID=X7EKA5_9RHOB|nr:helix-turn-helix transcriptional regulator [Roseivivax halodurans]ETX16524.1 XRE family transcriptional regulator [Roseivivax halodurans JCM 10272]